MGDKSAIQWTDATWNPIAGCSMVSSDPRTYLMERVGKKAAGRLLDGREWNEYPNVKA